MSRPSFVRSLGLTDATMLVVGCIVGAGIFRSAGAIAGHVASPSATLVLWLLGGLLSLGGALCYAELAAMFPATGGDYIFITQTYGRFWGFLFGWTKVFVERTGTIAILGKVFGEYASVVLGLRQEWTVQVLAAAAILLLTSVNILGVRWGKYAQNVFTALKIFALVSVVCAGVAAAFHAPPAHPSWSLPPLSASLVQSAGVALVFVLWTYGGWTEAAYVAEEVQDPSRNIPRAIIGGVLLTAVLYLLVNWTYLLWVPLTELAQSKTVAATIMQRCAGQAGALFMAIMIGCSAFGAVNGYILTGGRILYALGKDHPLFAWLGAVHPRFHTPAGALWINALVAIGLVCTKTFDQIATYSTLAITVFFTMAVFAVIILRRTRPELPRPYRTWGYPFTPWCYGLLMIGFMVNICVMAPRDAVFGFGFLAIGLPLYWCSQSLCRPIEQPSAAEESIA